MNVKELIKWHEIHELTFKEGDIIIYEGNDKIYSHHEKYVILYINPFQDKYTIMGTNYTEELGVYEDCIKDFTHYPDEKLLGYVLNEVDDGEEPFSLYKLGREFDNKYCCDFNKSGDIIAVDWDTVDGDSKIEVLLKAWKMKIEANIESIEE